LLRKFKFHFRLFLFVCRKLKIHFKKAIERAGYNRRIKFVIVGAATDFCVGM